MLKDPDPFEMEQWLLEEIDSAQPEIEISESDLEAASLLKELEGELEDFEDEGKMREILVGQGFNPQYRVSGSLTPKLVDAHIRRVLKSEAYYYLYMRDSKRNRYFFKRIELDHPAIYRAYVSFHDRGKEFNWDLSQLGRVPLIRLDQYHLKIENYRENLALIQLVKEFREQGHMPFYIVEIPEDANYTICRTPGCEWLIRS